MFLAMIPVCIQTEEWTHIQGHFKVLLFCIIFSLKNYITLLKTEYIIYCKVE